MPCGGRWHRAPMAAIAASSLRVTLVRTALAMHIKQHAAIHVMANWQCTQVNTQESSSDPSSLFIPVVLYAGPRQAAPTMSTSRHAACLPRHTSHRCSLLPLLGANSVLTCTTPTRIPTVNHGTTISIPCPLTVLPRNLAIAALPSRCRYIPLVAPTGAGQRAAASQNTHAKALPPWKQAVYGMRAVY